MLDHATLRRERHVLLCVDAIQQLGAYPFHARAVGAHLYNNMEDIDALIDVLRRAG